MSPFSTSPHVRRRSPRQSSLQQILEVIAAQPERGDDAGPCSLPEAALHYVRNAVGMLWFED